MATKDTLNPAKSGVAAVGIRKDGDPHGLAEIQAEMSALADKLQSLVAEGRRSGSTGFRRLKSRASDRFDDMAGAGGQVMHSMGNELASVRKRTVGAVRRHPIESVAIVLGIGILIVALTRR